jgi:hypothetical protein
MLWSLFHRQKRRERYNNELAFPWRVMLSERSAHYRVINNNNETVCELLCLDRKAADRIVALMNADDEKRRNVGYENWLFGK